MRPAFLPALIVAVLAAEALFGQQSPPPADVPADPTAESPAIQERLDAVRGVEALDVLRRQLTQLTTENQRLSEQLVEVQRRAEALQDELTEEQQDRQQREEFRQAVPALRLVAQIESTRGRWAEIEAAEERYRILDGRGFLLQLTNGHSVEAEAHFHPDGTVEIDIPELEIRRNLAFRPSIPR